MAASSIEDRCDCSPLTLGDHIMLVTLEWLFDISLAVTSAAATGSIFLLLLELGKVARKHCVQQHVGARLAKVARLASRRELLY
jgi:hypothetical protein